MAIGDRLADGIEPTLGECAADFFDIPIEDVTEDDRDNYLRIVGGETHW